MYTVIQTSKKKNTLIFTEVGKKSHTCISMEKASDSCHSKSLLAPFPSSTFRQGLRPQIEIIAQPPKCWDYTMPNSLLLTEKQLELIFFFMCPRHETALAAKPGIKLG